jgi:hypothetical protein
MNRPTLRALARLLAPWRTIRRLERANKWLTDALANPTITGMAIHENSATVGCAGPASQVVAGMFLGLLEDNPGAVNYLQLTFGSPQGTILVTVQRPGGASPHDLRIMAEREAREAKREAECLRQDLAIAREAIQRLIRWCGVDQAYNSTVALAMMDWAARGMVGPLPPLPKEIAMRELRRDARAAEQEEERHG